MANSKEILNNVISLGVDEGISIELMGLVVGDMSDSGFYFKVKEGKLYLSSNNKDYVQYPNVNTLVEVYKMHLSKSLESIKEFEGNNNIEENKLEIKEREEYIEKINKLHYN